MEAEWFVPIETIARSFVTSILSRLLSYLLLITVMLFGHPQLYHCQNPWNAYILNFYKAFLFVLN